MIFIIGIFKTTLSFHFDLMISTNTKMKTFKFSMRMGGYARIFIYLKWGIKYCSFYGNNNGSS